ASVAGHDADVGTRSKDRDLLLEKERIPLVVAVEQRQELSRGRGERDVAGAGHASIRLAQQPHARIAPGHPCDDLRRSIDRAVVRHDDFEIAQRLTERGGYRLRDPTLGVVRRCDYADEGHRSDTATEAAGSVSSMASYSCATNLDVALPGRENSSQARAHPADGRGA